MNLAKEHVKTFIVIDARVSNIKWIKERSTNFIYNISSLKIKIKFQMFLFI